MWKNNIDLKKQYHKYRTKGLSIKNRNLNVGSFGIKVLNNGFISFKIIKAVFNFLKKRIKKNGKIILNISPNMLFTKKPLETRMGRGKGNLDYYAVLVKKGKIILEVEIFFPIKIKVLLEKVINKINLKSTLVYFKF